MPQACQAHRTYQYLLSNPCFYTLGKLQILKLRRDYQEQEGAAFRLQKFHDCLLSQGAPPLRILREQLLRDPAKWAELF